MKEDMQTLTGEKTLEVAHRDGSKEQVTVREMPIRKIPRLLELQDDEPALVEMYTGKDAAWVDGLTTASFEAIVEAGAELNFPIIERWMQRKAAAVSRLMPLAEKVRSSSTKS